MQLMENRIMVEVLKSSFISSWCIFAPHIDTCRVSASVSFAVSVAKLLQDYYVPVWFFENDSEAEVAGFRSSIQRWA